MLSQFLDSVVFVVIAFYGSMPVFEIIIGQWVIKMGIALLDTPLVYAGVWAIRRSDKMTSPATTCTSRKRFVPQKLQGRNLPTNSLENFSNSKMANDYL